LGAQVSVWSFLDVYKQGYINPVYDDSAFPLGKSLVPPPLALVQEELKADTHRRACTA
jgi:hypothetical protein